MGPQTMEILPSLRLRAEGGSSGRWVCVCLVEFPRLSMSYASDGSSVQHVLAAVMLPATSYHKYTCFRKLLTLFRLVSSSKF